MKNNTKLTFKIYFKHLKKYRFITSVSFLAVIGAAATNAIIPLYFKRFFDVLSSGQNKEVVYPSLLMVLLLIFGLEMLQWVFWRVATFTASYYQSRTMRDLANTCFVYLHGHSYSFFNNTFVGSLVKKVNRFVRAFEGLSDRLFWNILPLIVNISIILAVLFRRDTFLGIIIIVWIVLFLIFNWVLTKKKLKYDIERSRAETENSKVLADTITNNINVKLFCGHAREKELFAKVSDRVRYLTQFTWNYENIIEAVQGFIMTILEVVVIYWGIKLWQKDLFSIGDFVLLQSYLIIIFLKVWDFGRMVRGIYRDMADAEEMAEIFDTPHEVVNRRNAKKLKITKAEIKFEKVNFYYHKTRKVINKLNLTIKPKQKLAFVGPSGAGKSTIIRLLLRLHDVASGKILIDGQKISDITMESLWKNISLVPQDPILFHRTLMENIRYGKLGASDEDVIEAAKLAHCHEFIEELPEAYKTYVGERGVKLSGGERQRVAIARAILRNAPILVLDEATSSLDSESEMLIQDALNNLMRDKTVIVIAHRLSTIMKMNRIVVIDNGEVIEDGTHRQLLRKKGGVYKRLWKIQAGGFIK